MKVPAIGKVRPSGTPLGYLKSAATPRAFGAGVAQSLLGLGVSVRDWDERTRARNEQVSRFDTLRKFGEFEIAAAEAITELKRSAPPNAQDFVNQAESVYSRLESEFISKQVPGDLQDEFRFRTGQVKQRIVADSLDFQYTQQDAFFRQGIADIYTQAQNAVAQNPDTLTDWSLRLAEALESSDLPQTGTDSAPGKAELARQMSAGLAAVVYKSEVERVAANETPFAGGDANEIAAGLLRDFEGFRGSPYWDVNALRTGYGSDTITLADGSVQTVTKDTQVSREDAERDLARRIGEFQQTAANQVGKNTWAALSPHVQAALISVTYNYGSLPSSVVEAVGTGDAERIASAVESLSANPGRRKQEASVIRGGAEGALSLVRSDPFFDEVPLDTRLTLEAAAFQNVQQERNEAKRLLDEQNRAAINSLFVGLVDGTANAVDTAALRQAGILTDVDDILKAEKLLEDRQALNRDKEYIAGLMENPNGGSIYNHDVDSKGFNNWVGDEGLARIGSMEQAYMDEAIIPAVAKFQDIPSNVIGQLEGMSRSTDPAVMGFALNNLATLSEQSPAAFNRRVTEDLSDTVDNYKVGRNLLTEEEMISYLSGGRNAAERAAFKALDDEANRILTSSKFNLSGKVTNLTSAFWDETPGNWASVQVQLEQEYAVKFRQSFRMLKNEDTAAEAAARQLAAVWKPTRFGGHGNIVMRHPIESVYAPKKEPENPWGPFGDTTGYEPYEAEIKEGLGILDTETFQLVSDYQTVSEVRLVKAGQLNRGPSYAVVKYTEDGTPVPLERRWYGALENVNAVP